MQVTLLTIKEKCEELKTTPNTLRRWRLDEIGPEYIRHGGLIRYFPEPVPDQLSEQEKWKGVEA